MGASPGPSRPAALAVLALVIATLGGGVLAVASRTPVASEEAAGAPADPPSPASVPDRVETFRPALRATVPAGVPAEAVQAARGVPGVAATARLLLANLVVEVPGGDAQVSVVAVEPDDYRPLAPESTAQARFVWESLQRSETLIAHEQYQIFGGQPLETLAARGPGGRSLLRIAGLATNGVPNLAGAMMSLQQAEALGLTNPTLMLVGLAPDADPAAVQRELERAIPGTDFSPTTETNRSFLSGAAARRAIGSFSYVTNGDGTIDIDRSWVSRHITRRAVPLLGEMACHRLLFPQLEGALAELRDAGLGDLIKPGQFGGCYSPRFIQRDGSNPLSMHAWGLAVDINVAENPPGQAPRMDPRVVAVFERWGFRWGGRWSPPDGHHFELAALLDPASG